MDQDFKTIKVLYKILFSDPARWNYYFKQIDLPKKPDDYEEFCRRYIELSGKLQNNPLTDIFKHPRCNEHVFSVFFLGILIYNNCKIVTNAIDKKRKLYEKAPHSDLPFPYFWFIIALFHDTGYKYESDDKIRELEKFKRDYDIKNSLKRTVGVPEYMSEIYEKYFKYRFHPTLSMEIKKPDHGILGGLLLNDSLNKIYEEKKRREGGHDSGFQTEDGLWWSKKLLNIYNLCSWVILSHNIFYVRKGVDKKEVISLYNKCKLDNLILEEKEESKISLPKYPFLFLLCLVDTIEPYKMGKDNCWAEIENNYKINFNKNSIDIQLPHSIPNYIKQMENWLAVDVKSNSLNQATITFK